MSGAVAPRSLAPSETDPDDVWEWYRFQRMILSEERTRAHATLTLPPSSTTAFLDRYRGKSTEDLVSLFSKQNRELDLLAILGLLAATEGQIWRDVNVRVQKRYKDPASRRFQVLKKKESKHAGRLRFEEDILDTWRANMTERSARKAISDFKGALNLRHWLAHGRYWREQLGRDYGVEEVFVVCVNILKILGI